MRVYHFLTAQHGLENIELRRLKIARISELNDPFEWMARAESERERAALRSLKEVQNKRTGLLCFSQNWQNPVQWTHYAERHRGICLGFDIHDENASAVGYRKTPIKFDVDRYTRDPDFAEKFSIALVTTKFLDWNYEREIRVFVRLDPATEKKDGLYFYDFSDQLQLREIIVGAGSDVSRQQIDFAVKNKLEGLIIRKARIAFNSYRIVEQNRRSLWK